MGKLVFELFLRVRDRPRRGVAWLGQNVTFARPRVQRVHESACFIVLNRFIQGD